MTCRACGRLNLPGGVRCIYCGTPVPPAPDFDLGAAPPPAPSAAPVPPPEAVGGSGVRAGLLGGLLLLAFKAKSLPGLLLGLGKLGPTVASMLLFVWAEALFFGWRFAFGLAVCILIHELGHVIVNVRHGIRATAPMFIPFLGAAIFVRGFPEDPRVESESGAGGPAAGMLASFGCLGLYGLTDDRFWLLLATFNFAVNLFNLVPFFPLDGARIGTAFSRGNWDFILIGMLLWVLKVPVPILWLLLVLNFLVRLGKPVHGRHDLAAPLVRARMAAAYLVLAVVLGTGMQLAGAAHARQAERSAPARTATARAPVAGAPATTRAPTARPPEPPPLSPAGRALLVAAFIGTQLLIALLVWLLVAHLLARASGEPFGKRGLSLVAWLLGALLAVNAAIFLLRLPGREDLLLLGAYAAASVTALVFAIYRAAHGRGGRQSRARLTWGALAWAAGAALAVAYAASSLVVPAAVLLGALVFYARRPWLLPALGARHLEQMGDPERALSWRQRALAWGADREGQTDLWLAIARGHAAAGRGSAALAAMDQAPALAAAPEAFDAAWTVGVLRAEALVEAERFDEALAQCEALLRLPAPPELTPLRILLVRAPLARLARYRGWFDEAAAQAGLLLGGFRGVALAPRFIAYAYQERAAARAGAGDLEGACADADAALRSDRSPGTEAAAALVRAEVALAAGDPETATRATATALRRSPGDLRARYWSGRTHLAAGRQAEGEASLAALAAEFAADHWGHRAREALGTGDEVRW